jgi:hypothetical protein
METGGGAHLDGDRGGWRGDRPGDALGEDREGLMLLGATGLLDERAELGKPRRHLGGRDHVEAGDENRRLDDRMAGADMPEERPPLVDPLDPGDEPLPLPAPVGRFHPKLERQRRLAQPPPVDRDRGDDVGARPGAGHGAGEEEDVIGDLKHPGRCGGKVPGRLARGERLEDERLDPAAPHLRRIDLRAHRRQMRPAIGGTGDDQPFEDHGEECSPTSPPLPRPGD